MLVMEKFDYFNAAQKTSLEINEETKTVSSCLNEYFVTQVSSVLFPIRSIKFDIL
jgi:hypothetical protein